MAYQTIIDTPYPTLEETAEKMGVSLSRARELAELVARQSGGALAPGVRRAPRRGAERAPSSSRTKRIGR